jgi:phage-related minor tail protein
MDESGGQRIRQQSPRTEGALAELAQFLVDNPLTNQALQVAFRAGERASHAGAEVIRNLNLPTSADVDRLTRRVRALSERLETVEDTLDDLTRELAELRRERASQGPSTQG